MLKLALILASWLVSPAALASDDTAGDPGDDPEKGVCYSIGRNKNKCLRSPTCRWDPIDDRCEPETGFCLGYINRRTCDAHPDCIWDAHNGICELEEDLECGVYVGPRSCNLRPYCVWNTFEDRCEHI